MTNAELIAKIKAEIERRITDNTFGAKLELIDILAWLDTLEEKSEKPINLDFEQELYNRFGQVKDFTLGMRIAQYFYELGETRMKEQMMKDGLDAVKSCQFDKIEKTIAGVFVKYGMDMQKQDMMKEAVEGDIGMTLHDKRADLYVRSKGYLPESLGIKCNDKVRLIIIKGWLC